MKVGVLFPHVVRRGGRISLALALALCSVRTVAADLAVESVGMTVSDLDRSVEFYSELGFHKVSETELQGAEFEHLEGVFGARARIVRMQLGTEFLDLSQYLAPPGRPIPADSQSNDLWFQHIAIVVRDMDQAFAKVRADKEREAHDGHDGTWVAHPGMVQLALDAFDAKMPQPNQIGRQRNDVKVTAKDLLDFSPSEPITEAGLRQNISIGVQYIEAWLRGHGAVPLFNLMEDAATAEISRAQVWQWIRHPRGVLSDGRKVTKELFRIVLDQELMKARRFAGDKFDTARELFDQITTNDEFVEFLTLPGYDKID